MKKHRPLRECCPPVTLIDRGIHVPVDCQQIKPAVVVVIKESIAPSEEGNCYFGNSSGVTDVSEIGVAFVAVQRVVVVRENRVVEIESSIVQIVANRDPHRCLLAPVLAQGESGHVADILERAVVAIVIEIVRHRIVRDDQVNPSIVIHVDEHRSKTVIAVRIADTSLRTHVRERTIPIVVEQMITFSFKTTWSAHDVHSAKLTEAGRNIAFSRNRRTIGIEFDVSGNK